MIDQQQASPVSEHPWTPGPWYWSNKGGVLVLYREVERGVILRTQPQAGNGYDLTHADAALIALAPAMAAAILAHTMGGMRAGTPQPSLLDVAERLRSIIKEHTP